jgi:hypothetical protein
MATINSVEFYLSHWNLTPIITGKYLYVDIRSYGNYSSNPTTGTLLGTSIGVSVDSIPLYGSADWITFSFSTPIEIDSAGFYSMHLYTEVYSKYDGLIYAYGASDWIDAITGSPYDNKERGWVRSEIPSTWTSGYDFAYRVNCTDMDNNVAEIPTSSYFAINPQGNNYGIGIRSYLTKSLPEKPINPTPIHEAEDVSETTGTIDWEDGGGAKTYNVYFGEEPGNLTELITGVTDLSWMSPDVVLEINDYNPVELSGYRPPSIGDILTLNDSAYSIWNIQKGHSVNGTFEAKLYCLRTGLGPGNSGDILTNGVSPDINNPQAVRVTLNNSLFFTGDVESAYYPFAHTFYWRVDAVNEAGITTGDEWKFTIFDKKPPIPHYNLIGTKGPLEGGVEGVDYEWDGLNNMYTVRRLLAASRHKLWYESI